MSSRFVAELSADEARSINTLAKIVFLMGIYFLLYEVSGAFLIAAVAPDYIEGIIENLSEEELKRVDLSSAFNMFYSLVLLLPVWYHFLCVGLTLAHFLLFPKFLHIILTIIMGLLVVLLVVMSVDGKFIPIKELIFIN